MLVLGPLRRWQVPLLDETIIRSSERAMEWSRMGMGSSPSQVSHLSLGYLFKSKNVALQRVYTSTSFAGMCLQVVRCFVRVETLTSSVRILGMSGKEDLAKRQRSFEIKFVSFFLFIFNASSDQKSSTRLENPVLRDFGSTCEIYL